MTTELDAGLWPDFPSGANGTPSPRLAERHSTSPAAPVTLPSGDQVPMLVLRDDVRALLACPHASRDLTAPGLPRMVTGMGVDDVPGTLITMDDPEHGRQRRIVAGAFTPPQAERWRKSIRSIADELIDDLPHPVADLVPSYSQLLSSRVICQLLGVPTSDYTRFRGWTDVFLTASTTSAEARLAAYVEFLDYTRTLVARHRAEPGDDLVDRLIKARDETEDRLSEDELVHMIVMLITAGHDTTAMMISRGIFRLLQHPAQLRDIAADPALIEPAVEEILRYDGPGTNGLLRRLTAELKLPSGTVLPAGSVVLPNPYAANHDPTAYENPAFDIHRPAGAPTHLAFGHGPHYCLGASLARVELQEALLALTMRAPDMRLAVPYDTVVWRADGMTNGPAELPVLLEPHEGA